MMTRLREMWARLRASLGAGSLDRDFAAELDSHLAMLTDENVRRGMSPAQARRAALMRMGNPSSIAEQHRAARALPMLEAVVHDLRFAFRLFAKERWFSTAAIAVLALGIGANATGFTIVNAAFLKGPGFEDSDRLHVVSWQNRSGRRSRASHAELLEWRASRSFSGLAGYSDGTVNISDDRALPEQVRGTRITANAFRVLRQPPLLGRDFLPEDERPGAQPVVAIAHGLWINRFDGDANVLGRTLRVNGQPAEIVGVMPEGMKFPDKSDLWMPFIPADVQTAAAARTLWVYGRLADGFARRQAAAEMIGLSTPRLTSHGEAATDLTGIRVETFPQRYIGGAGRPMFLTVMGAVVFVLLIACANVANLLLSRSAHRAREIAVRTALGASRWRVVRQLLAESLVLAVAGAGIGMLLAYAGVRAFGAAVGPSLPYWVSFTFDFTVFTYVAALCVFTALVFGLAPALHVSRTNNHAVLKEGGRGTTGSRRLRRFGTTMAVIQLALTIVLLVGAGSMIRSFYMLYSVDLGIETDGLMAMQVHLPETKYPTAHTRRAFFERVAPRLGSIPGVRAAALTTGVPPLDGGERLLEVDGRPDPGARPVHVGTVTISPTFFDVVGVRLLRGRTFGAEDGAPGFETAIVNERLAAQFFPGEDPLGRRLRFTERQPQPGKAPDVWRTIVGITPLIKQGSPSDEYVNAVVYLPYREEAPAAVSLLVRSVLPPGSVMDAVRVEVQAVDPDQPVFTIQTVAQVLADDRWWYRTWSSMFGLLAAIGLVLSSVGLYGVLAYAVTQRTPEIGVRMALGARRSQVVWLVLRRGAAQLAAGLTVGFAASIALRRLLPGGVAGMTPHDPSAIAAIIVLLALVSLAACLVPARRATRVDPVIALRAE